MSFATIQGLFEATVERHVAALRAEKVTQE